MTTALIIGGGIAGPATAMALQRAGIEATVYEAHEPAAANVGSYLTVSTNGLDALRAIDAHQPVLTAGFPTTHTVLFSGSGKRLGVVPIGSTHGERGPSQTIQRAALHRALHEEAARRGVRIEFGKRLVTATPSRDGVLAEFDDGSQAVGHLLVGCDGIHSTVRKTIDPAAAAPRYVGLLNFGGYTPGMAVGEPGVWHMIFGARAFFGYARDLAGGTVWFVNVPRHPSTRAERESTMTTQWRGWLLDLVENDRGPASQLIRAGDLQLAADNTHDLPSVPRWHRAPLIIVGDAAHAPSPSSGQGASMALEDGVVLARCLRDVPGIPAAFETFERIRRRRVERIVAQGARSSSSKTSGPFGRLLRDQFLPFVFRYVVTDKSLAWMYDHHIDWNSRVAVDAGVA